MRSPRPGREGKLTVVLLTSLLLRKRFSRTLLHSVRDMTCHTTGHSLQFSLHGDDELQTGLAPPDVPPDLPEDVQTGPGVLSCQSAQLSAVVVSVERMAHCHGDQEEGHQEDGGGGGGGLHDWGEARTRTDG